MTAVMGSQNRRLLALTAAVVYVGQAAAILEGAFFNPGDADGNGYAGQAEASGKRAFSDVGHGIGDAIDRIVFPHRIGLKKGLILVEQYAVHRAVGRTAACDMDGGQIEAALKRVGIELGDAGRNCNRSPNSELGPLVLCGRLW